MQTLLPRRPERRQNRVGLSKSSVSKEIPLWRIAFDDRGKSKGVNDALIMLRPCSAARYKQKAGHCLTFVTSGAGSNTPSPVTD